MSLMFALSASNKESLIPHWQASILKNISDVLCANSPFSKLIYPFCVNQPPVAVLYFVFYLFYMCECVYACLIEPLAAKEQ